jgi:hypothetical protein
MPVVHRNRRQGQQTTSNEDEGHATESISLRIGLIVVEYPVMSNYDHNSIENAEVMHILLTPFRRLFASVKWFALLAALLLLFAYNQTAWIFSHGDQGLLCRQEISEQIAQSTNSSVWNVDFTHREVAGEGPNLGITYTNSETDKPALAAFRATPVGSSGTRGEPIFCQDSANCPRLPQYGQGALAESQQQCLCAQVGPHAAGLYQRHFDDLRAALHTDTDETGSGRRLCVHHGAA